MPDLNWITPIVMSYFACATSRSSSIKPSKPKIRYYIAFAISAAFFIYYGINVIPSFRSLVGISYFEAHIFIAFIIALLGKFDADIMKLIALFMPPLSFFLYYEIQSWNSRPLSLSYSFFTYQDILWATILFSLCLSIIFRIYESIRWKNTIISENVKSDLEVISKQANYETGEFVEPSVVESKLWLTLEEQKNYFESNDMLIHKYAQNIIDKCKQCNGDHSITISHFSDPSFYKKALILAQKPDILDKKKFICNLKKHKEFLHNAITKRLKFFRDGFDNQRKIIMSGVEGEERVKAILVNKASDNFRVISNFRIEYKEKSAETDLLVIAESGIYCIEVKNYGQEGNYSIYIGEDGKWFKKYGDSKMVPIEGNPFAQNMEHIEIMSQCFSSILRTIVGPETLSHNLFKSIICVPNDVFIENNYDSVLLRPELIYSYITRNNTPIMNSEKVSQIANSFEAKKLKAKSFPIIDYMQYYENNIIPLIDNFESICNLTNPKK